jgi:hypothetical protein
MSLKLEKRIAALEQQVASLQRQQQANGDNRRCWLDDLYGKFEGDPVFAEAMKLGKKYRQSLRPRSRKAKSKR